MRTRAKSPTFIVFDALLGGRIFTVWLAWPDTCVSTLTRSDAPMRTHQEKTNA